MVLTGSQSLGAQVSIRSVCRTSQDCTVFRPCTGKVFSFKHIFAVTARAAGRIRVLQYWGTEEQESGELSDRLGLAGCAFSTGCIGRSVTLLFALSQ